MKRKHTAAWLSRHSGTQHSKDYDRQYARGRMKAVMARHKRANRAVKAGGTEILGGN